MYLNEATCDYIYYLAGNRLLASWSQGSSASWNLAEPCRGTREKLPRLLKNWNKLTTTMYVLNNTGWKFTCLLHPQYWSVFLISERRRNHVSRRESRHAASSRLRRVRHWRSVAGSTSGVARSSVRCEEVRSRWRHAPAASTRPQPESQVW